MSTQEKNTSSISDERNVSANNGTLLDFQAMILENVRDSVIVTDLKHRITYWNRGATLLFGYNASEMMGKTPAILSPEKDSTRELQDFQRILDGQDYVGEWQGRRKDGTLVWIDAKSTVLRDHHSIPTGFISVSRDITERKVAEERAQKSESRFRSLIEKSTDAISLLSADGKILYTSPATQHILGYTPEEFMALSNPFDIIHPEDQEHVLSLFANFATTPGASVAASYRVRHKDGTYRWIESIGTNFLDDPAIGAIVSNYRDITERKHFEEQVRERDARLRRLVDANIIGVVIWDLQGNILDANDVFLEMVGYTREDMSNGSVRWTDMTPQEFVYLDEQALQEMHQYGAMVRPFEKEYIRKDGSHVPIMLGGAFLDASQQEGVAFILDISTQKELERRKDDFISMASHELKTPVTSIKAYTQVLRTRFQKRGDEETVRFLTRMDTQLSKLSTLISDLLDVTKMQTGKLAFREEAFMLDALVRETVENVQEMTPTHNLLLESEVDVPVYGDKDRIGQVVINLLTNAIKYSPHADAVAIRVSVQDGNAVVSIQDFGIGIAEVHQAKIFERFYQVTDPLEKTFPGLGIGLYISNEIIQRYNGRMEVKSIKGKGSTFSFRLPLQQKDGAA